MRRSQESACGLPAYVLLVCKCLSRRMSSPPRDPQYNPCTTFGIEATADSRSLLGSALRAFNKMWRPGYRYAKAGVVLLDLHPAQAFPASMFPTRDPTKSAVLMRTIDALTDRHGRGAVRIAATAPEGSWNMRRRRLSPRYTTAADEMMEVRP